MTGMSNNSIFSETMENPTNPEVQPVAEQSETAQPKSTRPTYNPQIQIFAENNSKRPKSGKNPGKSHFEAVVRAKIANRLLHLKKAPKIHVSGAFFVKAKTGIIRMRLCRA